MTRDVPLHSDNIVMIIIRASGSGKRLACADPPLLANLFVTVQSSMSWHVQTCVIA
ncbi:hypothetical protein FS749_006637 [Ceratobasidium sp. UAMH 11750]|nr:hypothetical protein FS749_006637 [Ceratobasidium sp. UAMH 11750]